MGIKEINTTTKHFLKKRFSTPTNAARTLVVTGGTAAAVMPTWQLVTALLDILGAVMTLGFILAATIGLLWLVSNWKSVWLKFTNQVAESVNGVIGKKVV